SGTILLPLLVRRINFSFPHSFFCAAKSVACSGHKTQHHPALTRIGVRLQPHGYTCAAAGFARRVGKSILKHLFQECRLRSWLAPPTGRDPASCSTRSRTT